MRDDFGGVRPACGRRLPRPARAPNLKPRPEAPSLKPSAAAVILLRDALAADAEAVAAIYRPAVETGTASFEEVAPTPAEMAARMAAVATRGLPWLVADVAGRVVGYAYAAPYKDRAGYRFTVEDSVYVAPAAQGRGVGRALLDAVITRCSGRELRQMIATVGDALPASVRLHERCGFRVVGRLDCVGVKFDRERDVLLMQRALG